jgi:hypothetical protein
LDGLNGQTKNLLARGAAMGKAAAAGSPLARLTAALRPPAGAAADAPPPALSWDEAFAADARDALALPPHARCAPGGAAAAPASVAVTAVAAALLRRCGAALGDEATPASALACVCACAAAAADALAAAGPSALGAKARPRELALQRYGLARRMVARGCAVDALAHAAAALRSFSDDEDGDGGAGASGERGAENVPPTPTRDAAACHDAAAAAPLLLPLLRAPRRDAAESADDVTLAVGAALCCVGAAADAAGPDGAQAAVLLAEALPPWLRRAHVRMRASVVPVCACGAAHAHGFEC